MPKLGHYMHYLGKCNALRGHYNYKLALPDACSPSIIVIYLIFQNETILFLGFNELVMLGTVHLNLGFTVQISFHYNYYSKIS